MDSGWLGILKASAWQLLGLSLGLFGFWLMFRLEFLPATESLWVVYGLPFAMLIVGGLAIMSLFEKVAMWFAEAWQRRKKAREQAAKISEHQNQFIAHLPYLKETECAIYGWLLTNSQKSFTAEMNCGHGSSLFKRGYIVSDAIRGIAYGMYEFPFSVPDHIWTILEENKDQFPSEFKDRKLPWFRRRL